MRTSLSIAYRLFCAQILRHLIYGLYRKVFSSILILLLLCSSFAAFSQEVLVGLTSTGGPAGAGTSFDIKTTDASFTVHHNFVNGGFNLYGDLIKGKDGFFYGMTFFDDYAFGTIFKMSGTGVISFVKHFDNSLLGSKPQGSLIQAIDGNFYGMTSSGGIKGYGTIFKMTPTGSIAVLKTLDGSTMGGNPRGSLIQAKDSNFYGMTWDGGTNNKGTIFKITPTGVFTVLKNFNDTTGNNPYGNLIQAKDSNFYGMTNHGGTKNYGTIFKITSTGTLTVLKNLDSSVTGSYPRGTLFQATDGNFYGMTPSGGTSGYGTIFKITSTGTLTVIKNFDNSTNGSSPFGSLVQGSDGNFYGMTHDGGTNSYGTIFKVTSTGILTVLKNLDQITTGGNPFGTLYKNNDGYFYGMTQLGTFKISALGTFTVLFSFPDGGFGKNPSESLVQGKDGNYYGMALIGGKNGDGTVYRLCTSGAITALRSFNHSTLGANPSGSLIQATDGNFYGMTQNGGTNNYGTIFKMTPTGSIHVLKTLDVTTGVYPQGSLIQARDGTFYGMIASVGVGYGTIFKITSTGTFTVLKYMDNTTTGAYPYGSLLQGPDGNFYGMTPSGGTGSYGTIFRITSTGTLTVLKNLNDTTGKYPEGSLIKATDGYFYGMTHDGGTNDNGTIFRITPNGILTVLKNFDGSTTGGHPQGDLVQGRDGTLYGMTYDGGTFKGGTIFKITTTGTFTVLRHLNPSTDGANPTGNLIIQKPNPVANPQTVSTPVNTLKKIVVTGSGGTPLTYAVSTKPLHGTATVKKDTIIYTPTSGYVGADSLYFTATWGCQKSIPAKIKIIVTSTAPIIVQSDASSAPEEKQSLSGDGKLMVTVRPNPSSSYFTITTQSSNLQPVSIRVVDEVGRTIEVINNASANGTIRVGEHYQNGLYFAEVIQGKERVSLKLMKGSQ